MEESTTRLKTCNLCGIAQPAENFHRKASAPDGLNYRCKICASAYRHQHYTDNLDSARAYYQDVGRYRLLNSKYGVDKDLYNQMLADQAGVCAICKLPPPELRRLHLDHDHVTGKARGLLCAKCNSMLTHFGDRPEGLLRVLDYVQRGVE